MKDRFGPTEMTGAIDRKTHWQNVYHRNRAEAVSWYRPHLDVSLELLADAGLSPGSRVIDVGGGASTLVDDLLERGLHDVSVADVCEEALAVAQRRLGDRAQEVHWYAGDILDLTLPVGGFDLWHDRAALHFLTSAADTARYAQAARYSVAPGGHIVVGGFAPDGPERCSGLSVARRSADEIAAIFSPLFRLSKTRTERHRTPAGLEQSFVYVLLMRR
jgi:SAM-dependent methyltransferase